MVLAGFTVVGEFHYLHHAAGGRRFEDPNAMGVALLDAARAAGIRITLLDTVYLEGGLTADGHLPLDEVQQRFSDGSVGAWAQRVDLLADDATSRIGTAVRHRVSSVGRSPGTGPTPTPRGDSSPVTLLSTYAHTRRLAYRSATSTRAVRRDPAPRARV